MSDVEEILLIDKFLDEVQIRLITTSMLKSGVTKKLILRGNSITERVASSIIAKLLEEDKSLVHLSLEWNSIKDGGLASIGKALEMNVSLTHLDVRNNQIGNDGALAILASLHLNDSLRVLDLRWNMIDDSIASTLKEVITKRTPSLSVLLNGNLVSAAVMSQLQEWAASADSGGGGGSWSNQGGLLLLAPPPPPQSPQQQQQQQQQSITTVSSSQSFLLQKENSLLRAQCISLQQNLTDLHRQLDSSALRIIEYEQSSKNEEFRSNSLNEALKSEKTRVSILAEEQRHLTEQFETERQQILSDFLRVLPEKDAEIRTLTAERDRLSERVKRSEEISGARGAEIAYVVVVILF